MTKNAGYCVVIAGAILAGCAGIETPSPTPFSVRTAPVNAPSDNTTGVPTKPIPDSTVANGIYIAGVGQNKSGTAVAAYWVNGVIHPLSSGQSYAYGIAVTNKGVYVSGQIYAKAAYWKNGTLVPLTTQDSQAFEIAVVGNDVYIVGIITDGSGYGYAVVWKNGVQSQLTEGTTRSSAGWMAVSGNDVYISGNIFKDGLSYGVLWKNGVAIYTTDGGMDNGCSSIAVSGNDVYVLLRENGVVGYWHNGQIVPLTGDGVIGVSAIAVDHGSVYVVGVSGGDRPNYGRSTYWKDGVANFNSADPLAFTNVYSISLINGDVYATGCLDVSGSRTGSAYSSATYWVNSQSFQLPSGYDGVNIDNAAAITNYTGNPN